MNLDDLSNLIKSRRSVRVWQDKPVPEDLLLKAIELATYASNAGNQQNWRFYVILNKKTINAIADAVQKGSDYVSAWPETSQMPEAALKMLKKPPFFRTAPAVIAMATSKYQSPLDKLLEDRSKTDPRAADMRTWRTSARSDIQSVSAAVAYLLLVLHQMGLGAVWMTAPTQVKGDIEKIIKIPPTMDFTTLIPIGYPAEAPPLKERKPVKDVCEIVR